MSFHVAELIKIQKATSKNRISKRAVSKYVKEFMLKLDQLNNQDSEFDEKQLLKLLNEETRKRQQALSRGAASYSNVNWAGPAACESLLQSILLGDENEINDVKLIIFDIMNSNQKDLKNSSSGCFSILLIFSLLFLIFNFFDI
jgi:hypothetical protein